tara:strand:- start:1491 stop:1811 length:321 start_codon:yes stop_codon:yes gene_type:complete
MKNNEEMMDKFSELIYKNKGSLFPDMYGEIWGSEEYPELMYFIRSSDLHEREKGTKPEDITALHELMLSTEIEVKKLFEYNETLIISIFLKINDRNGLVFVIKYNT